MKTTTSFWKRCLAWAMALVLLVSGSNLGVALQAFATEDGGASLTAGEIVAAHYDLPEGQKALLKSGLLDYGDTYTFADVCAEKGLVSVDTKTGAITARPLASGAPCLRRSSWMGRRSRPFLSPTERVPIRPIWATPLPLR